MVYKKNYLQLFLIVIGLLMFHAIGYTQNYHFIYLQSANRQPYTVHINQQDWTSTSGGYLIIPKLMPGDHQVQLQWQQNPNLILNFTIPVTDQDAGYNITKSETGNWQLNGLSNELVIAATLPVTESAEVVQNEKMGDTTTTPVSQPNMQNKDSVAQEVTNQINNAAVKANTNAVTMPPPVVKTVSKMQTTATQNKNSIVSKTFEKMGAQGLDQIYVDKSQAKADTIAVFIPLKQAPRAEVQPATNVVAETPVETKTTVQTAAPVNADTVNHKPATEVVPNSTPTCIPASKEDFNKTRIDMASSNTDAAMIDAAKKAFEKNCYTVEQIKNLGILFLSQQNRLQFFAAAKNHIVDVGNFHSLINQFIDPNIIEQFKLLEKNN
ncbi:MAG: DUF4476 domain-containing protein [Sphingobacteriales bacterium]|uniref:DUF4476 domain-containing protein n=1 Tax=Hydrotalea flava TaxID=714549 RepID=UPI0008310B57|nr:DUF4476 domain-containing protein [Hydrotalea flava]RTL48595.1 MAG: DUF4476 domain-containing protein [Sphingobacteriales bacterium]